MIFASDPNSALRHPHPNLDLLNSTRSLTTTPLIQILALSTNTLMPVAHPSYQDHSLGLTIHLWMQRSINPSLVPTIHQNPSQHLEVNIVFSTWHLWPWCLIECIISPRISCLIPTSIRIQFRSWNLITLTPKSWSLLPSRLRHQLPALLTQSKLSKILWSSNGR